MSNIPNEPSASTDAGATTTSTSEAPPAATTPTIPSAPAAPATPPTLLEALRAEIAPLKSQALPLAKTGLVTRLLNAEVVALIDLFIAGLQLLDKEMLELRKLSKPDQIAGFLNGIKQGVDTLSAPAEKKRKDQEQKLKTVENAMNAALAGDTKKLLELTKGGKPADEPPTTT